MTPEEFNTLLARHDHSYEGWTAPFDQLINQVRDTLFRARLQRVIHASPAPFLAYPALERKGYLVSTLLITFPVQTLGVRQSDCPALLVRLVPDPRDRHRAFFCHDEQEVEVRFVEGAWWLDGVTVGTTSLLALFARWLTA